MIKNWKSEFHFSELRWHVVIYKAACWIIPYFQTFSFRSGPSSINYSSVCKPWKYTKLWRDGIASNMHANMKTPCKTAYHFFAVCKLRCIVNSGTLLSAKYFALGCYIWVSGTKTDRQSSYWLFYEKQIFPVFMLKLCCQLEHFH